MNGIKLIVFLAVLASAGWGCSNSTLSPLSENKNIPSKYDAVSNKDGSIVIAQDTLFTIISDQSIKEKKNQHISNLREIPATKELYIARLNESINKQFQEGDTLAIPVNPKTVFVIKGKQVVKRKQGYTSWIGPLMNIFGSATLVIGKDGVTGTLTTDSTRYQFEPVGDSLQAIIKLDPTKFPPTDSLGNNN